ncbi:MAG: sulfite exporter TauE/SafE family protein, partial [Psychromonas sp.]
MGMSLFALIGACMIGLSLGLIGSGGSILTVPVLVYLVDQPEKIAIAGSLIIVGSISVIAAIPYIKQRLVDWHTVWLFGIPGMLGTYAGAWISIYLSGLMQLAIFALVMLVASYFMLRPQNNIEAKSDHHRQTLKIIFDGLVVGIITGVVGVGGGFLVVPALVLLGGLTMRNAVATSLVIIALKSFSGFVKYLDVLNQSGLSLDWQVIGIMVVLGGLGSVFGNKVA